jgi:hypothetical protein
MLMYRPVFIISQKIQWLLVWLPFGSLILFKEPQIFAISNILEHGREKLKLCNGTLQ